MSWTENQIFDERKIDDDDEDESCEIIEQDMLDCNTHYVFTVWAYSPTGLEGEKEEIEVVTKSC